MNNDLWDTYGTLSRGLYVTPEGDAWCCGTCYRLSVAHRPDEED